MIVTFCGHSTVEQKKAVEEWLYDIVEGLILQGYFEFYLGGYGDFDIMASLVVTKLKEKYPQVERTLVIPYLDREIDEKFYDNSYYPSLENVPKKFAIIKRNEVMVDEADVVIACVINSWGGAVKTLNYARKKQKKIYNFPNKDIE